MKRPLIELDFIRPPRRPVWLGLILLALALAVAGHFFLRWQAARNALYSLETARGLLNADRPRAKPVPLERLDEHVKAAEGVMRNLNLPWASLIETLENVAAKDVAVLQIQPDAQQRLLRITAEARNAGAMWLYVRNLSAANTLEAVHLISHQVQNEDPQKPLQFSVQATMRKTP